MLIFAFTSKTGQSVARYTHQIFLFGFFSQREDIFTHFIGLISSSRHKNEYCFKQYSSFILVVLASAFVFQPLVSTCNLLKRYYRFSDI